MEWSFVSLNAAIYARVSKLIELEKIEISPELEKLDPGGKVVFKGPKIEKLLIGASYSRPRGLMGHGLIYPSDDYDYPAFAWDWGAFMGRGYVFTLVNLHPLRKNEEYRERYVEPIKLVYEKYARFHSYQKEHKAKWAEPFHSGYDYCGRIPLENVGDSINLIVDYLDAWLKFWGEASPQEDPELRAESLAQKKEMRETYKRHDHGRAPYARKYGRETAKKLLDLLYGRVH